MARLRIRTHLGTQDPSYAYGTMQIVINGKAQEVTQGTTLARLIEQRGLEGKRVAIELNREVVPRSQYVDSRLCDGDRVEIVAAIGGG